LLNLADLNKKKKKNQLEFALFSLSYLGIGFSLASVLNPDFIIVPRMSVSPVDSYHFDD